MATIYQNQGMDVTWKTSGGTHVLTLTSLANNAGRKGDLHDFGANSPQFARVDLLTKFAVAPTALKPVEIWWASSADGSNFSAALAAGDAAQNDFNLVFQLHFVGALPALAVTTAQRKVFTLPIPARYGFPVVMNNGTGQALSSTAADHVLTITPILGVVV